MAKEERCIFVFMAEQQKNNPLHGVTLEAMLVYLEKELGGWRQIGFIIPVNCFLIDPSLKSSLTFLRKTPWARQKVEELYLDTIQSKQR